MPGEQTASCTAVDAETTNELNLCDTTADFGSLNVDESDSQTGSAVESSMKHDLQSIEHSVNEEKATIFNTHTR